MDAPVIPSMRAMGPQDLFLSQGGHLSIIGIIRTPFRCVDDVPIQPYASRAEGRIEIFPEFREGLSGIEGFSHIILLYLFHRRERTALMIRSRLDNRFHGIFSTREPQRPSPIGLSTVRLTRVRRGVLWVYGVDMMDQTPLLDIKPYVPAFDRRDGVSLGWMEGRVPE
jgi:tRNA-Thr(GGU) m(6)t(6)A37 methyltransferase TsaA